MIGFFLSILLAAVSPAVANAEKLSLRYHYDKTDEELALRDIRFLSKQRVLAVGVLTKDEKPNGVQLSSTDGGTSWTIEPLRDIPRTMFFLDDSLGWLVTEGGIWRSEEAGRSWKKLKSQKNVLDIHFVSAERGFAVGAPKLVLETRDGGKKWTPVAEAAKPDTKPENSVYSVISFANPKLGIIAGYSIPPRRGDRARLPDWMEPEEAKRRGQRPTVLLDMETRDGGETWKADAASIFGRPARLVLSGPDRGFIVFQFDYVFPWRSEVFRFVGKGKTERVYREKGDRVTDVLLQKDGTAYLAGVQTQGEIPGVPIPGRIFLLKSTGPQYNLWQRVPVDYRGSATNVRLAESPDGEIWAVTDLGMILSLRK